MPKGRLKSRLWKAFALPILALVGSAIVEDPLRSARVQGSTTKVSIAGTNFLINGQVSNQGTPAEGLLLNSRMVQALFDDENLSTLGKRKYPDSGTWDPERNINEFITALGSYRDHGLNAVTVGLQGGFPGYPGNVTTAFEPDGSLKTAWMSRLDRLLAAADAEGIVVILQCFYQSQDDELADDGAVRDAIDNVVDWVIAHGYSNVMLEIANESNVKLYSSHKILQPTYIHELITQAQVRSHGKLSVSTSFVGGAIPPANVRETADFILLHGKSDATPEDVSSMVDKVRRSSEYKDDPRPIVFNEAGTSTTIMDAAIQSGASWGYYDQGLNNYRDGFQSPPVNWTINTSLKRDYFEYVADITGSQPLPAPTPTPSPTSTPTPTPSPSPTSTAGLYVSLTSDRSDPELMEGQTLTGDVYIHTSVDLTAAKVDFYLDGSFHRTEKSEPFDFNGGTVASAQPFKVSTLSAGTHTVTAKVSFDDGSVETVEGSFSVSQ
jgi:hypothetical protein